ncbi:MAG: hypothetical protein GVY19_07185 [Bacteroidetes bacterium]|nr:hypothetical protein [Bacteroidota bacterium]
MLCSILLLTMACEEEQQVDYQEGYPNRMAGNWYVYDFNGKFVSIDSLHQIDIQNPEMFEGPYYLSTALDPESDDSIVIQNIYNANVRVKARLDSNRFFTTYGKQLEVFNLGGDSIRYVSLEGYIIDGNDGDIIVMTIGLYQTKHTNYDSIFTYGFRKTGWEDYEIGN